MFRTGKWAVVVALVGTSVWAGLALTAQEPPPANAQPADLTPLREAVAAAAKRGENVDEVRKALAALEKALPGAKPGAAPPELQALRDAVEAAARKGENVEAVQKELAAVETAVTGRALAPTKPVPPPARPNLPVPAEFDPVLPGRVDPEAFQRANELRIKALELLLKNPNDPEAQKLTAEAQKLMLKSLRPNLNDFNGPGGLMFPEVDPFPNLNRVPERARFGIRFEKLSPLVADQLGLDPDVGVAVAGVVPGSPAERAGLKVHDIVLQFAGKPASANTDEFIRQVSVAKAGEKLDVVVLRKGKKVEIKGVVLPAADGPAVAPAPLPDLAPRVKPLPVPAVPKVAPIPEKVVD
ncbi:Serine protease Do-like HtrB [Gemmata obscuriglobus]|uniref:PDZ domain-containing protein n=1 Tax=Gemmata obscuriglobus TaxID=114 RepID=A0A2Z3H8L9_9BACT|nr:PDZ domain-containing protein [Gemmata obscuriglobus]AWM40752.1 PDZ domain-containing protein [Gemmata obscuriglobus]QEG25973.1 Serine protease Do-like HtrB [Gemmata obscuriglobus]VTS00200.1 protease do : Protease Do OS=Geobacter lovleyi (strain ATCC BAA-1151 / DSM 17278 / SZ) GN=Glov_0999 PE=4 SV=1: PDZ_2 [Gemmata obscuriglobus UQM 2246]